MCSYSVINDNRSCVKQTSSQFLTSDKAGKVKAILGVGRPRARGEKEESRRRAITTWEIDSPHKLEWEINHLHEEKLNCKTLDQFRNNAMITEEHNSSCFKNTWNQHSLWNWDESAIFDLCLQVALLHVGVRLVTTKLRLTSLVHFRAS